MVDPSESNDATLTIVERRAQRVAGHPGTLGADATTTPVLVDIVPDSPLQLGRDQQPRPTLGVAGRSDG